MSSPGSPPLHGVALPDHNGHLPHGLSRFRHRRRPARVVLFLEDSLFCEVVRTALQRLDRMEVLEAADVAEAAELTVSSTVDVVVLDADAGPPASVVRDVEYLVRLGEDVRVIALLADEDHELISTLLDAGATSCVSKSVYPSDLGAVIRQAARGTVFHRPDTLGDEPGDHGDPGARARTASNRR